MTKEYCHVCREGGKQCVSVKEEHEYALLTTNLRCSACGKPLAQ